MTAGLKVHISLGRLCLCRRLCPAIQIERLPGLAVVGYLTLLGRAEQLKPTVGDVVGGDAPALNPMPTSLVKGWEEYPLGEPVNR